MSTTPQLPVTLIYTDVSDSLYVGRQLVATARFLSDELIDSVLREYGLPRRGPGPSQWPALSTCLNADGQLPSDLADVCVPVEFQAQLDLVVQRATVQPPADDGLPGVLSSGRVRPS